MAKRPPPGSGWRYHSKTRGYANIRTGETLSRRQYDKRFGILAREGFGSYEAKARARRAQGILPGAARGRETALARYYRVVQRLRKGEFLTRAAKAEGTTPATVWRLDQDRRIIGKVYKPGAHGKHGAVDHYELRRQGMGTFWTRDGALHVHVQLDGKNIRVLARYLNATKKAKYTGDDSDLRAFDALPLYDVFGNSYELLTDANALMLLEEAYAEAGNVEELFQSGEGVLHAA
jgi:hypothetical protein